MQLPIWLNALVFLVGVVLLIGGGESLVRGAIALASRLGVPPLIVGLTVVAFGTSAPELALNVVAAINDRSGLSFGNIVGSNIANIGLIIGLSALIKPLKVNDSVIRREMPLMLGATVLMLALAYLPPDARGGNAFSRVDAAIFLAGFILFMRAMLAAMRSGGAATGAIAAEAAELAERAGDAPPSMPRSALLCLAGLALLAGGGKLAEVGAVGVAETLGLSEEVIGLTIVAVATSLPELATSLMAARRGQADIAVGNVVGSNLFNILLIMGVTAMVRPVTLPPGAGASLAVMVALSFLLWPMSMTNDKRVARAEGFVLLAVYAAYIGMEAWFALRPAAG